jgi:hypothetical protein
MIRPEILEIMSSLPSPFRYDVQVPTDGRIEVQVPLPAGSRVTVYVVEQPALEFNDLFAAAASSTDFWDNEMDDEDWNNA